MNGSTTAAQRVNCHMQSLIFRNYTSVAAGRQLGGTQACTSWRYRDTAMLGILVAISTFDDILVKDDVWARRRWCPFDVCASISVVQGSIGACVQKCSRAVSSAATNSVHLACMTDQRVVEELRIGQEF
jgi:hypothetical protein